MNIKLIAGTLGLVSMFVVSLANAVTVNLTPSSSVVNDGDPFGVTVQGVGFFDNVASGNVTLTWDDTILRLDSTLQDIKTTAFFNGFGFSFDNTNLLTTNQLDFNFASFSPVAGPDLDFFSLMFTMIAPSTSDVTLALGPSAAGTFQSGLYDPEINGYAPITGITFNNATIAVSAVPIPAAVWLLASGLLGLIGVARRRSSTATTRISTASPALA